MESENLSEISGFFSGIFGKFAFSLDELFTLNTVCWLFFQILLAFLGASLASFCMSLASRFCGNFKLFSLRSFCLVCKKKLGILELIPVFSYVFLRARCKHCRAKLPLILFLSELTGAVLLPLCFYLSSSFYDFCILSLFLFNLFLLSLIDLRLKAVPDLLLWSAFFFAFLYAFDEKELVSIFVFEEVGEGFLSQSAIFAGFVFLLKTFTSFLNPFKKDKKEDNLGEADIIILACMSGILGFKGAFGVLFMASVLALPFFLFQKKLAFLPFLSLAFVIIFFYKNLEN